MNKVVTLTLPTYYTQTFAKKKSKTSLIGLNWYRNVHFLMNNKVKHYYHEIVKDQIGDMKFDTIRLQYRVYISRAGTDGHNIRSVIEKYTLDGLVECGAIIDDSTPKYVIEDLGTKYFMDSDNPRMEIDIIYD